MPLGRLAVDDELVVFARLPASNCCKQSFKLPLHGTKEILADSGWTPTGETKAKPPGLRVSQPGKRSAGGSVFHLQSCSRPVPVPASRLLLPVDPDLPLRDTIHFRIRMGPALAAAHGSSSGQGLGADETW